MSVSVCLCEKENTREREQEVFCVDNPTLKTVPHNQKEKERKEEVRIVISMTQKLDRKEKRFRFRCVIKNMFKACTDTQPTRTHTIHLNTSPILKQGLLATSKKQKPAYKEKKIPFHIPLFLQCAWRLFLLSSSLYPLLLLLALFLFFPFLLYENINRGHSSIDC